MTKYEYRMERTAWSMDQLNEWGEEGWIVIHIFTKFPSRFRRHGRTSSSEYTFLLMREKEEFIDPDEILGVGSAGDPI